MKTIKKMWMGVLWWGLPFLGMFTAMQLYAGESIDATSFLTNAALAVAFGAIWGWVTYSLIDRINRNRHPKDGGTSL